MNKKVSLRVLVKKDPRWPIKPALVRSLALKVLKEKGISKGELSVFLVGSRKAKELNQVHRKQNYVPQVLAFPVSKEMPGNFLGDVVICLPLLRQEAVWQNRLLEGVLEDWLRHGVGNLLS